ncbi:MAG: Gfo/Idh/MocA family oxidoreductase [Ruminococcaceae bacterium]|nr:Gfo/Idh/MocA family oxidoreductase [Oscillospiraceae bacterium]
MERKLGYAVVGLGVGMGHCDAAIASEKAELVAVCDLIPEKMEKVAAKQPGLKMYTDFEDLLKDDAVECISICLPSSMHAEFAVRAMEAGKHVLVEKPIDITVEAALKIEEARKRTGKKAGVIHQNRFNLDMLPIKEAIDSGRIGKVFLGTFAVKWYRTQAYYEGWHGTWEVDGGGSLMNQAVHTVDLMQWFMGDVESVTSNIGIFDHEIDTEDMSASLIKFKSGASATFVSTTCAYPGLSTDIQIYGTGGSIEADQDVLKTWKMKEFDEDFAEKMGIDAFDVEEEENYMIERYGKGNGGVLEVEPEHLVGHRYMVEDMICAVLEDRDPAILPMEAIKSVRIVNAVYESAKTGKTVYLD